jgi:hypothetical protein
MIKKSDTGMIKFLNNPHNELLSKIGLLYRGYP